MGEDLAVVTTEEPEDPNVVTTEEPEVVTTEEPESELASTAPEPVVCTDHTSVARNCISTGCCIESSYTCFKRDDNYAECLSSCTHLAHAWSCDVHTEIEDPAGPPTEEPEDPEVATTEEPQEPEDPEVATTEEPDVVVTNSGSPVQKHGRLIVKNGQIFDQNGRQPVQLKGTTLSAVDRAKYWTSGTVNWLVDDWKVSLVRIPVYIQKAHEGPTQYLDDINDVKNALQVVVDAAIAKGIYVVIAFHMDTGDTTVSSTLINVAKIFFTSMGQLYGHLPNMLFEPYNEPTGVAWGTGIKPVHQELVRIKERRP